VVGIEDGDKNALPENDDTWVVGREEGVALVAPDTVIKPEVGNAEKEKLPVEQEEGENEEKGDKVVTPVVGIDEGENESNTLAVDIPDVGMGEGLGLKDTVTDSVSEDV